MKEGGGGMLLRATERLGLDLLKEHFWCKCYRFTQKHFSTLWGWIEARFPTEMLVYCPSQLHQLHPSAGAVFVQLAQKQTNLEILKIFTTSSEIMIWNKTVQTNLSCNAIIYFSKQLWKYIFFSIVAQQQWACALLSNKGPSQFQCFTLSSLVAALVPPTGTYSFTLNKNGYIRSGSVSSSSPVAYLHHHHGGEQSDTLQEFYTFDLHLLITLIETIHHMESWPFSPLNSRS